MPERTGPILQIYSLIVFFWISVYRTLHRRWEIDSMPLRDENRNVTSALLKWEISTRDLWSGDQARHFPFLCLCLPRKFHFLYIKKLSVKTLFGIRLLKIIKAHWSKTINRTRSLQKEMSYWQLLLSALRTLQFSGLLLPTTISWT